MGMAGMKWRPHPSILYSFFTKLNEETLLKISIKILHLFQKLPIFQKHDFFKNGPKNLPKVEKLKFFCIHGTHFYRAFQWYIACFGTLSIPSEIEAFTAVKFHSPPTVLNSI